MTQANLKQLNVEVAEACRLLEGPQGVARVVLALVNEERLPTRELARQAHLPLPVVAAIKKELQKRGILRIDGPACLTEAGRALLERSLGMRHFADTQCPACRGIGHRHPPGYPEIINKVSNYYQNRPRVDTKLDQSQAEPETSLLRAAYMLAKGAVLGRKMLFLGDDDLVSLATLIWVRETIRPQALKKMKVAVVDKDPRYIEYLGDLCKRENLEIALLEHDLREPLPKEITDYETFVTDPPYTLPGSNLFISRGVDALVKDGTGMGFFCFGDSRQTLLGEVQKCLCEMELIALEIVPGFNRYVGSSILANSSAMLWLAVPVTAHPLLEGEYTGKLYTYDFKGRHKIYSCLSCGRKFSVGSGRHFETVESLKEVGCPSCGEKKFKAYG